MSTTVVCNEPVSQLKNMRTPRLWLAMLDSDLPGKLMKSEIQLNHALADEEKPLLDDRLVALYTAAVKKFAALHGENTKCFLVRVPESLDLVGIHTQEFGGSSNAIACFETIFCVSPRTDSKVHIAHVEDKFHPLQVDLFEGLSKARQPFWPDYAQKHRGNGWADIIRGALQFYVNSHKGPTGQIELNIPGLNIVAGAILPPGMNTHSDTTLTVASLIAISAATGEWGKVALSEFALQCAEAQEWGVGRKNNIGAVLFGMPGEVTHIDWNPPRPKGHKLAAGTCFVTAYSGCASMSGAIAAIGAESAHETAANIGHLLFRQAAAARLAKAGHASDVLMSDETVYQLLREIPQRVSRKKAQELIQAEFIKAILQPHFSEHSEPNAGYPAREKLMYVLSEIQRAARAANLIRKGDAAGLGELLNIGQIGEAGMYHELSPSGLVEHAHSMIHAGDDAELDSLAEHVDPLWKQSGFWGGSAPETDLLCDLAQGVNGVYGARCCEPERIIVIVKKEALVPLLERLSTGYYGPRNLPATYASQVFPCRGAGVVEG